eukprot:UN03445
MSLDEARTPEKLQKILLNDESFNNYHLMDLDNNYYLMNLKMDSIDGSAESFSSSPSLHIKRVAGVLTPQPLN